MTDPINLIYEFNKKAGLIDQGYDDQRESAFSIEEMLEGFKDLPYLATRLHPDGEANEENFNPKQISRQIIKLASMDNKDPIPTVDRVDKHIDSIVFNFGSLFKIGLNKFEAEKALEIVATANMQKLSAGKDEHGKQKKPANFVPPEEQLQKLLDKALDPNKLPFPACGKAPINDVIEFLEKLGADIQKDELETNGWEVDYWQPFTYNNKKYMLSGSMYFGYFNIAEAENESE